MKPVLGTRINPARAKLLNCVYSNLFNERAGLIVKDGISNKAYNFNATYTPSWYQEGVSFNADRCRIDGPALNTILPAGISGTVLFGYYNLSTPSVNVFFALSAGYTPFGFMSASTALRMYLNGSYAGLAYTRATYLAGKVLGVKWISSGGSTTVYFYKDGVMIGSASVSQVMPDSSDTLSIGSRADAGGYYAGGVFKWYHIFNHALSDQEISKISADPYWMYQHVQIWMFSSGKKYVDFAFTCENEIESNTQINRVRSVSSATELEAEIQSSINRVRNASFVMELENEIQSAVTRLRNLQAQIQAEIEETASASRIRNISAQTEAESENTAIPTRIRELAASIETEIEFTIILIEEILEYINLHGKLKLPNSLQGTIRNISALNATVRNINQLYGVMEMRDLYLGNKEVLRFTVLDDDDKRFSGLASATEIEFQIKEQDTGNVLLTKKLSQSAITRDDPKTGDLAVTIAASDKDAIGDEGRKNFAVRVTMPGSDIRTLKKIIDEDDEIVDYLEFKNDPVVTTT